MSKTRVEDIVKMARREAFKNYDIAKELLHEAADKGLSLERFSEELKAIKKIHAKAISAITVG